MRNRFWLQLGVLFVLALQGVSDMAPLFAPHFSRPTAPQNVVPIALKHADYCHCLHCASAKTCCCHPSQNLADAVTMRAACDTPHDSLSGPYAVRALPSVTVPVVMVCLSRPMLTIREFPFSPNRAPEPLEQPPRIA